MIGKERKRFGGIADLEDDSVYAFHLHNPIFNIFWNDSNSDITGTNTDLPEYVVNSSSEITYSVIIRIAYWHSPSIKKLKLCCQSKYGGLPPALTAPPYNVKLKCGNIENVIGKQNLDYEDTQLEMDISDLVKNEYNEITVELRRIAVGLSAGKTVNVRKVCVYGLVK